MGDFDHRIYYIDSGIEGPRVASPVIVFIHGSCSSSRIFTNQISYFRSQYRCIAINLFGHGKSSCPDPGSVGEDFYSLPAFANAITALLTHLSIQRATFVGWSLGNAISLTIARVNPGAVDKLVLIASSPVFFLPSKDDEFPGMPPSQVKPFLDRIRHRYQSFYQEFVELQYPEVTKNRHTAYFEEALEDAASCSAEVIYTIVKASGSTDFREFVPQIVSPMLIINGGKDPFCPVSAGEWMLKSLGDKSLFILLENCGHVPFVGPSFERFNYDMEEFLVNGKMGSRAQC